jgi:hypothetical protein
MMFLSTFLWLSGALLGVVVKSVEAEVPGHAEVGNELQRILSEAYKSPSYTYPTSLTQGIIPVCFFLSSLIERRENCETNGIHGVEMDSFS